MFEHKWNEENLVEFICSPKVAHKFIFYTAIHNNILDKHVCVLEEYKKQEKQTIFTLCWKMQY